MDVKSIAPAAVASLARSPQGRGARPAEPQAQPRADQIRSEITGPLAQRILEDSGIKPAEIGKYRVKLDIDDDSGRVVAEVRDKESGELVNEVPSRKLLRQAQMLKEAVGMILDKPV
ncbi:MAG: flagellar protein FlaG [Alphaproteobacteria bacterium]|nr:flagellar protein FlaG [Alphaproteobacteria bacterium]